MAATPREIMSLDIDMESFAGVKNNSPAAVEEQVVDRNSYLEESGDVPAHDSSIEDQSKTDSNDDDNAKSVNPQSENFRALRAEVDRIKAEQEAERRDHQIQIEMLKANIERRQEKSPEVKSRQMFEDMKGDDIPNVDEIRREWSQREAAYQSKLEELQVQQSHPDYAEVIEKFALPLIKQKPHLLEGIQNSSNKALMAYELGKMAQAMQAPPSHISQKSENAQRIVDNAKKPGTLSQAGGQAALSKADYFASMSDKQFMEMASRNLEGI